MGGLVSRRKNTKVEARSVSTQATECHVAGSHQLRVECRPEEATDLQETDKAAVTELTIGDGHRPPVQNQGFRQHGSAVKIRPSNENKKRRGLSTVKSFRPKSANKKGPTQSVDFSTQYDFLSLPGQVPPRFTRPDRERNTESRKHSPEKLLNDPEESVYLGNTSRLPKKASKRSPLNPPAYSISLKSNRDDTPKPNNTRPIPSPRRGVGAAAAEAGSRNDEQDENCNILKEGTLLGELRNRELYGACTDEELGPLLQRLTICHQPSTGRGTPCGGGEERTVGDHSPRRQRKKTVTYSDDCKDTVEPLPPSTISPALSTQLKPEFRLSLEEIFQDNIPCSAAEVEVVAVTGTGSVRRSLPPSTGYHACWNNDVPFEDYSTGTVPIENDHHPDIDFMDAEPESSIEHTQEDRAAVVGEGELEREEEDEERSCQGNEDMVEDTLDWNVDDRVHSPSDSRSDSVNLSGDDDNVDLLEECAIDAVPSATGQRLNSSLTTLKDGGSAGGSVESSNLDLHSHQATPAATGPASAREDLQAQSQVLERGDMPKYLTCPNTLSVVTTSHSKKSHVPDPAATAAADGGADMDRIQQTRDMILNGDRRAPGPDNETGTILMQINGKTIGGEKKSLLQMKEAEAMTLLLFTGTLPGEDGGGVTSRGAGDAQTLETATGTDMMNEDARETGEITGLASMLDSQSKTSCQLEQLQLQQSQTDGEHKNVAPQDTHYQEQSSKDRNRTGDDSRVHAPNTTATRASPETRINEAPISTTDGGGAAAAASLDQETGDETTTATSPGAASSGDWEVIPLHRVAGQTSIGASEASAPTESEAIGNSPSQHNVTTADSEVLHSENEAFAQPIESGLLAQPMGSGLFAQPMESGLLAQPMESGLLTPPMETGFLAQPIRGGATPSQEEQGICLQADENMAALVPTENAGAGDSPTEKRRATPEAKEGMP